ncbi:MAG: aminoglycoside 6-adenylyltransferase [Spirochaetes bacterium]|nr:aminoglycoside 6-adenylyltransferase [Spirochaetota bacterium]
MRTEKEMLELIIRFAEQDSNILAVTMTGSRVNRNCICDMYSDFDIQYIVKDIKPYIQNKKWKEYFGELLIMQEPEDWFSHPYSIESKKQYPFLMQFCDGNRIDLIFVHIDKMIQFNNETEPRIVLLNKNKNLEIAKIESTKMFDILKPTEKEFNNIVNEFLWLSLYVLKGINRNEITYAKNFIDNYEIELLCKMVSWKIGINNGFEISLGKSYKYLMNYLSVSEIEQFCNIYSNGTIVDIYSKLLFIIDLFKENSMYVAEKLNFNLNINQIENVLNYIKEQRT